MRVKEPSFANTIRDDFEGGGSRERRKMGGKEHTPYALEARRDAAGKGENRSHEKATGLKPEMNDEKTDWKRKEGERSSRFLTQLE